MMLFVLYFVGVLIVGDKPEPVRYVDGCFLTVFPDNLEPVDLTVEIAGVQKGASWQPSYGDPPSGSYLFDRRFCARWYHDEPKDGAILCVDIYKYSLDWWVASGAIPFFTSLGSINESGLITFDASVTGPSDPFYAGIATVDTNIVIGDLPPSWDAADLVVVPKQTPYFAEELPATLAARKLRYACHRDGTNVKVHLN